jgi:FG-GAP repeat protein
MTMRRHLAIAMCGVLASGSGLTLTAGAPAETKLTAHDGAAFANFGWSIAGAGAVIAVGALGDDELGPFSGSAYVFERIGGAWSEVAKLTASDGTAGATFGASIAATPRTVVVGQSNLLSSGSAYVFDRIGGAWVETIKLVASHGSQFDDFGHAVAIAEDTIVVGAPADNEAGSGVGAVYVFERTGQTWDEVAKLTPSDGSGNFGLTIGVNATTIVVGSISEAAYVFERVNGAWQEVAKLTSPGPGRNFFGSSVAAGPSSLVVGAPGDSDSAGAAYVFERIDGGWQKMTRLTAADPSAFASFGWSVTANGNTIGVGAPFADGAGAVYQFGRNAQGWQQIAKHIAVDTAADDFLGWSVGSTATGIVAGAPLNDDDGDGSGSAYVF